MKIARKLLIEKLNDFIKQGYLNEFKMELQVEFKNSIIVYIRYNDYGEYGYQVQLSPGRLDRIRYDNYDDRWKVSTSPHHAHERYRKDVVDSPMIGDPSVDTYLLIDILGQYI